MPKTKIGYCKFGSRQGILGCNRGFLVATKCSKCQEQAIVGFGWRQGIPSRDRVLSGSVS